MRKITLPLLALVLIGANSPPPTAPEPAAQPDASETAPPSPATIQKPGKSPFLQVAPFRDEIYDVEHEMDASAWSSIGGTGDVSSRRQKLLLALAKAGPAERQSARWDYARFLIDTGRPIEGSAVLDAMAEDERLLEENGAFQGVRAIALTKAHHYEEALQALNVPALVANSDACLWRAYAHALNDNPQAALLSWPCAISAVNKKSGKERLIMALPMVRAAYLTNNHQLAIDTLDRMSREHPEVAFWRGVYAFRLGQNDLGKKLLTKVRDGDHGLLSSQAELELVNAQHKAGIIKTGEAIARLDKLRFAWRGGTFERDLLLSLSRYEESRGNIRGALAAAAPLIRYLDIGHITSAEILRAQQLVAKSLDPNSRLSLSDQAGIYWDYRDLAPQGFDGDEIIRNLAEKIAAAGLQKRAADLLERQIRDRLDDAAPAVAVRVAQWRLLSGQPEKALSILEETNDGAIPPDVRQQRQLLYLYSLLSLGRGTEAMAILDGNAEGLPAAIRAELYWQGKEWAKYMDLNRPLIAARAGAFDNDVRAMVVRQAIAASLASNEAELARLSSSYGEHFTAQDSPLGPAFRLLTSNEPIDEASLKKAMVDIEKAAPSNIVLGWISALSQTRPRAG